MASLFLDTNIFLHFVFFDEIPWNELVNDDYRIIIAPVVIAELDKQKRHHVSKIASRAKSVLNKVEFILEHPNSYPLDYLTSRPHEQTFDKFNLYSSEQDDSLLASIKEYTESKEGTRVLLVTHDTGPFLKAISLGIDAIKMDERFLMPSEKSDEQKEIEKLRKELNGFKNAIPKLSLSFVGGTNVLTADMNPMDETVENYLSKRFLAEIGDLSALEYIDEDTFRKITVEKIKASSDLREKSALQALLISPFPTLSKEQVDEYNRDLKSYQENYHSYLSQCFARERIISLSLLINLQLDNSGTSPADDIDVQLHFPDGFKLMEESDLPKDAHKPRPPYRPRHRFDFNLGDTWGAVRNWPRGPVIPTSQVNLNEPTIRQTNSYEVEFNFDSIKHGQRELLTPLIVVFPSADQIINFTIDYKIYARNIPFTTNGCLHVKIDKK